MEFVAARNPGEGSTLPFPVRLQLGDRGVVLKVRDTWPPTARVYCHPAAEWPDPSELELELVERVPVVSCVRRPHAALVMEDRYSDVFKLDPVRPVVIATQISEAGTFLPPAAQHHHGIDRIRQ